MQLLAKATDCTKQNDDWHWKCRKTGDTVAFCMSAGGASRANADALYHGFLETANPGFDVFLRD